MSEEIPQDLLDQSISRSVLIFDERPDGCVLRHESWDLRNSRTYGKENSVDLGVLV